MMDEIILLDKGEIALQGDLQTISEDPLYQ
jgi:hypothetical protein